MFTCAYCGVRATRVALYHSPGGGHYPLPVCGDCTPPCNHPGDPHAHYERERPCGLADDLAEAMRPRYGAA